MSLTKQQIIDQEKGHFIFEASDTLSPWDIWLERYLENNAKVTKVTKALLNFYDYYRAKYNPIQIP